MLRRTAAYVEEAAFKTRRETTFHVSPVDGAAVYDERFSICFTTEEYSSFDVSKNARGPGRVLLQHLQPRCACRKSQPFLCDAAGNRDVMAERAAHHEKVEKLVRPEPAKLQARPFELEDHRARGVKQAARDEPRHLRG